MENTENITAVNIINRDYPPYKGITGDSAADLAQYLTDRGIMVNVICVASSFRGKGSAIPAAGKVFRLPNLYNGNNRILRLIANVVEGYMLIRRARRIPCSRFIVMTDPSLLNMWAALMLRRRKWMLWAMDLYPESFVAWRLISKQSLLYKIAYQLTIKHQPQAIIALGPLQADYLRQRYGNADMKFIYLPCGICKPEQPTAPPQWVCEGDGKVCLAYLGNLGAPHSLEFLQAVIDNMDATKFRLILSVYGYGSKAQAIRNYAQGKEGVQLVEQVDYAHFQYVDIHLASLLPQCSHISVPSKSVSAVCCGSAIIYCGQEDSDNWRLLGTAGWRIPCTNSMAQSIAQFFASFTLEALETKKRSAHLIAASLIKCRQDAYEEMAAW